MNSDLSHVDLPKARQGFRKLAGALGEILCGLGLHYRQTPQFSHLSYCIRCNDCKPERQWGLAMEQALGRVPWRRGFSFPLRHPAIGGVILGAIFCLNARALSGEVSMVLLAAALLMVLIDAVKILLN